MVKVRCHIIAYWTKNEPNIEIVCAVKNRPTRRAHPGIDSLVVVDSFSDILKSLAIEEVL